MVKEGPPRRELCRELLSEAALGRSGAHMGKNKGCVRQMRMRGRRAQCAGQEQIRTSCLPGLGKSLSHFSKCAGDKHDPSPGRGKWECLAADVAGPVQAPGFGRDMVGKTKSFRFGRRLQMTGWKGGGSKRSGLFRFALSCGGFPSSRIKGQDTKKRAQDCGGIRVETQGKQAVLSSSRVVSMCMSTAT